MQLKVKRLHSEAKLPYYDHPGDAGLAVHCLDDGALKPGEPHIFPTGWAIEVPAGHVGLFMDRSSMAAKGIRTAAGVIDAGYRGECKVVLINAGTKAYDIRKGDKIAQLLIMPVAQAAVTEVSELSASSRGTGGFGSTGR